MISQIRATLVAVVLFLVVVLAVAAETARGKLPPGTVRFWTAVANCETGGRWDWGAERRPGEGPVYEGGPGFYWATWQAWARELGLLARYPHAYEAPRLVQIRVADYGRRVHDGYWGAIANGCATR
jgi:hypothetical protein